jgi:NADH-quinone oxidoreductase subunit L
MTIGALALAGVPPFSGFVSKDAILVSVLERAEHAVAYPWAWHVVYVVGIATAALTAIYSARLVARAFLGDEGEVAKNHLHDAPSAMAGPLIVLAALATVGGLLGLPAIGHIPGAQALQSWLAPVLGSAEKAEAGLSSSMELGALGLSAVVAIVAIAVTRALYVPRPKGVAASLEAAQGPFATLRPFLQAAWKVDATYLKLIVAPVMALARRAWVFVDDLILDRVLVDGAGRLAEALSLFARAWQTGRVPRYAAYFAVGVVAVLAAAVLLGVPQ